MWPQSEYTSTRVYARSLCTSSDFPFCSVACLDSLAKAFQHQRNPLMVVEEHDGDDGTVSVPTGLIEPVCFHLLLIVRK